MKLKNNLTLDNILESIQSSYEQKFSEIQIQVLIEGYNEGVEIQAYADPSIPYHVMRSIHHALSEFGNPNDCEVFKEKIVKYLYDGYDVNQIDELAKGMLGDVDESLYARKSFNSLKMYTIRTNLERNVNVLPYVRQKFEIAQINEIAEGLYLGLNVSCYASKDFTAQQMRLIRIGLEEGLDAAQYADPSLSEMEMFFKLDELRHPIVIGGSHL